MTRSINHSLKNSNIRFRRDLPISWTRAFVKWKRKKKIKIITTIFHSWGLSCSTGQKYCFNALDNFSNSEILIEMSCINSARYTLNPCSRSTWTFSNIKRKHFHFPLLNNFGVALMNLPVRFRNPCLTLFLYQSFTSSIWTSVSKNVRLLR